jgi:ribonuclease BN (tRNA processing enzyme)
LDGGTRRRGPPLFPVRIRDLPSRPILHDVPLGTFELPGLSVRAALICHPGPTVGYRLEDGTGSLAYLPDHEPTLGVRRFPERPEWTSGQALVAGADVLIHDSQYAEGEYADRVGWGHSSIGQAIAFAQSTGVGALVPFHHDPRHDHAVLDALYVSALEELEPSFSVEPAKEGATFAVGASTLA